MLFPLPAAFSRTVVTVVVVDAATAIPVITEVCGLDELRS